MSQTSLSDKEPLDAVPALYTVSQIASLAGCARSRVLYVVQILNLEPDLCLAATRAYAEPKMRKILLELARIAKVPCRGRTAQAIAEAAGRNGLMLCGERL